MKVAPEPRHRSDADPSPILEVQAERYVDAVEALHRAKAIDGRRPAFVRGFIPAGVKLDVEDFDLLDALVQRTGLTRQAILRTLVRGLLEDVDRRGLLP